MKKSSDNFKQIIQLLNDNQFHAGTSLGSNLNISRTAIWKAIKKLKSYAVKINSVKGKGYKLAEPLILLDTRAIKKSILNKNIKLEIFEELNSTNDYLKKFNKDRNPHLCLAERQTHGKGRLNRNWYSPFAQNVYLSLFYPFAKDISELSGLSLIVGLSLCKTIDEIFSSSQPALIKWPNDIVFDGKKLAGILVEAEIEAHGSTSVIIGIGVNVNMTQDRSQQINSPWTSLKKLTNSYHDRNILCAKLINNLYEYITKFDSRGLQPFLSEWQSRDYLKNKKIKIRSRGQEIEGKTIGIDEHGRLIMELPDRKIANFSSGETSVIRSTP